MEPDKFQCVGRMIRVLNLSKTVERMFLVIEGNINKIIDLLLPVRLLAIDHGQKAVSSQEKKEFLQWDIVSQKYKNNSSILDIVRLILKPTPVFKPH